MKSFRISVYGRDNLHREYYPVIKVYEFYGNIVVNTIYKLEYKIKPITEVGI